MSTIIENSLIQDTCRVMGVRRRVATSCGVLTVNVMEKRKTITTIDTKKYIPLEYY